jgi:hypothetical protein
VLLLAHRRPGQQRIHSYCHTVLLRTRSAHKGIQFAVSARLKAVLRSFDVDDRCGKNRLVAPAPEQGAGVTLASRAGFVFAGAFALRLGIFS